MDLDAYEKIFDTISLSELTNLQSVIGKGNDDDDDDDFTRIFKLEVASLLKRKRRSGSVKTLKVTGIKSTLSEEDVARMWPPGTVTEIRMPRRRWDGKNKGYAYVDCVSEQDAVLLKSSGGIKVEKTVASTDSEAVTESARITEGDRL